MPVGICGTARLMDTYSCRSGRSSQRKTGSGWERPAPAPWTTVYSFYSINLSDPLTITHKTATDLMEEGGWSWKMRKNNGIEELQRGEAEAGVCVFSRCLSAPFTTWRTLNSSADCVLPSSLTHSRERALRPFQRGSCTLSRYMRAHMYICLHYIQITFN